MAHQTGQGRQAAGMWRQWRTASVAWAILTCVQRTTALLPLLVSIYLQRSGTVYPVAARTVRLFKAPMETARHGIQPSPQPTQALLVRYRAATEYSVQLWCTAQ